MLVSRCSFAGQAQFTDDAALDMQRFRVRWFDHWLKGVDTGVEREATVRIYVMGGGDRHKTPDGRVFVGGRWRDEQEWPLARTTPTPDHRHANGILTPEKPGGAQPVILRFDPLKPGTVARWGRLVSGRFDGRGGRGPALPSGCPAPRGSKPLSSRFDVLVFQTPPLVDDVEVTGRLIVKLWAGSDAVDTDFTAKLVDVYPPRPDFPSGVALNISDGIVRARYRSNPARAEWLRPADCTNSRSRLFHVAVVPAWSPDSVGHFQQQLPSIRRQPKYGGAAQRQSPLANRQQYDLYRREASVTYRPARDSQRSR